MVFDKSLAIQAKEYAFFKDRTFDLAKLLARHVERRSHSYLNQRASIEQCNDHCMHVKLPIPTT